MSDENLNGEIEAGKIDIEKEEVSLDELGSFFREKVSNFEVSSNDRGVTIERQFDGMNFEIKFLPYRPMKPKISITNPWPASMEEMERVQNRDFKALAAFSLLEKNPEYELSLPLTKDDLNDFLEDLERCRRDIEDVVCDFDYNIRKVIEKNEKEKTEDE